MSLRLARLTISSGPVTLAGLSYAPEHAARSVGVVLAHGFTASRASMDLLAAYLCHRGYPCLTFDARGHLLGGSSGEMRGVDEAVDDLSAAVDSARARFGVERCALVGHSMGGLLSLALGARRSDIAAVVAIATGPHPSRGFDSPAGAAMLRQRGAYVVGAPALTLLRQLDGLAESVGRDGTRPTLFVAASRDVLVRAEDVRRFTRGAGSAAEFVEVDATHLDAPDRARGATANWLDRVTGGNRQ